MAESIEEARASLRARQGNGARYDAAAAPAHQLDWARRGTAYFARLLNELSDRDLDAPSALPRLSRRHVIAHVGYHARFLSEIVAWARTGQEAPFPKAAQVSMSDVALGASLPSRALRYLFDHSEVHLNVEWRDLSDAVWGASVQDVAGRRIALRETPVIRARALWLHAVDLGAGSRFADMPPDFIDALIRHHAAAYSGKVAFALSFSDRPEPLVIGDAPEITITGQATDVARWLCSRGVRELQIAGGTLAEAPCSTLGLIDAVDPWPAV
ncbi:maleylpyruvate isomerase family mycothiol-dependent enzyme [Allomesorhizobium camelthorni]|uniref:Maleylpyruvate isomerase family mycothiol-dependent enzyme n=1 Tax=Allomesorhizobium camelthorni TaxID=475069 RepID=A0A6G4WF33_9HYPH|nr:maleylpyruvate isomerase family mycothiol-dependent enzyme [Mesorhizobium camelthorni]NGO52803.1 maleylpyruvate isomerase family mycothiol-dependent enzyme [Mesorhizobium camelthorni]